VNGFVAAVPGIFGVGLEVGQLILCGVVVFDERVVPFSNERPDLFERNPQPLPGYFAELMRAGIRPLGWKGSTAKSLSHRRAPPMNDDREASQNAKESGRLAHAAGAEKTACRRRGSRPRWIAGGRSCGGGRA
jgi:hypothetical protein